LKLTSDQSDILSEIVNIGIGRAAASLSDLVGKKIDLFIPHITLSSVEELNSHFPSLSGTPKTMVLQEFSGKLSGRAILAFPQKSSLQLAQILGELDSEPEELDLDLCGILTEVGNIVLNGVLGSMGNLLESNLEYTVPELAFTNNLVELLTQTDMSENSDNVLVLLADARFHVAESEINGSLIIVFKIGDIQNAIDQLTTVSQ